LAKDLSIFCHNNYGELNTDNSNRSISQSVPKREFYTSGKVTYKSRVISQSPPMITDEPNLGNVIRSTIATKLSDKILKNEEIKYICEMYNLTRREVFDVHS
jgi:hypothetical protein